MAADATVARSKTLTTALASAYHLEFSQLWDKFEVTSGEAVGGDVIYFVVGDADTAAPTAGGDNTFRVDPGQSLVVNAVFPPSGAKQAVKLIASGAISSVTITGYRRAG